MKPFIPASIFALVAAAPVATQPSVSVDFEATAFDAPPEGFISAHTGSGSPESWVVENDPAAPSGKNVLVQRSTDRRSLLDLRLPGPQRGGRHHPGQCLG